MEVYISHRSAEAYWDRCESLEGQTSRTRSSRIVDEVFGPNALKGLGVPHSALADRKLHVLVGAGNRGCSSKYVEVHHCGSELAPGAFRRISEHVLIASPELLFVQMAASLTIGETVRLGCKLCGTYIPDPVDPARTERKPLTSLKKLGAFIGRSSGMYGVNKARRALSYVFELSNSHMETAVALLLCLPCRLGGYGISRPRLNYEIQLTERESRIAGSDTFRCDLYWKSSEYALEYYGRDWHTGIENVAHDSKRQGDLQFHGVTITPVTYEQVSSVEQADVLAQKVARRLGERLRKPSERCLEARCSLHALLVKQRR